MDEMINEMGVYQERMSKLTVYQTLMQLESGIKQRNNPLEQSHDKIKRTLSSVLQIPLNNLMMTISWTKCPELKE